MPSRALYTALALSRSDTGCSTVLIPWVEEPVMVTPEVVGHIDPVCLVELKDEREARKSTCRVGHRDPAHPAVSGVVADLEAEGVAIEGQGCVRVVMREEGQ